MNDSPPTNLHSLDSKHPLIHSIRRSFFSLQKYEGKRSLRIILAVSGGSDSSALLDIVSKWCSAFNWQYVIAHFNHLYRSDSDQDARFVQEWAHRIGYPYLEGAPLEKNPSSNLEAWFRRQRYAFFSDVLQKEKADWCFTAHTSSDVVETTIMQSLSGREMRTIQERDPRRRIARPMIRATKEMVEDYLQVFRIPFCQDSSNLDPRFLRNKIRHSVLPFLRKEVASSVDKALRGLSEACQQDHDALMEYLAPHISGLAQYLFGSKEWTQLLTHTLDSLPPASGWRLLETLFLNSLSFPLGRRHGLRLFYMLRSNAPSIELPGNWTLKRRFGGLFLVQGHSNS